MIGWWQSKPCSFGKTLAGDDNQPRRSQCAEHQDVWEEPWIEYCNWIHYTMYSSQALSSTLQLKMLWGSGFNSCSVQKRWQTLFNKNNLWRHFNRTCWRSPFHFMTHWSITINRKKIINTFRFSHIIINLVPDDSGGPIFQYTGVLSNSAEDIQQIKTCWKCSIFQDCL